jgi:hypothetical protein
VRMPDRKVITAARGSPPSAGARSSDASAVAEQAARRAARSVAMDRGRALEGIRQDSHACVPVALDLAPRARAACRRAGCFAALRCDASPRGQCRGLAGPRARSSAAVIARPTAGPGTLERGRWFYKNHFSEKLRSRSRCGARLAPPAERGLLCVCFDLEEKGLASKRQSPVVGRALEAVRIDARSTASLWRCPRGEADRDRTSVSRASRGCTGAKTTPAEPSYRVRADQARETTAESPRLSASPRSTRRL